ncbi:hypothetical protein KW851_02625 [Pseudomonas sp. PDM33]|uniref:hypothetical protein n=1 Tax=Pseudomonas sp. PDM33 TaxID=2854765 RepID=UPI001C47BD43|nr:hypothetical protein [Pseudomonas sp. PDM33]MBV7581695.1 hypothetical protein [Pseudomonas sp. PDM33]
MSTVLVLLKLLGVLVSGVLGVLVTLIKVRGESGELTLKGKIFVLGSISGVVLAVSSQIIESYLQNLADIKSAKESLEATQRLEKITSSLERTLQPIDSFRLYYNLSVSLDDPLALPYKKVLDREIDKFQKLSRSSQVFNKNFSVNTTGLVDGKYVVENVEIRREGAFSPNNYNSMRPYSILPLCFSLTIYKEPIDPSRFRQVHGDGDLRIGAFLWDKSSLYKVISKSTYGVSGLVDVKKDDFENYTGQVYALPDLAGAQLFMSFCSPGKRMVNAFSSTEKEIPEPEYKRELGATKFDMGNRSFWIKEKQWKKYSGRFGEYWVVQLPKDLNEVFSNSPE